MKTDPENNSEKPNDFEDAMKKIMGKKDEPLTNERRMHYLLQTKGSFILNKEKPVYPPFDATISSRQFRSIKLIGDGTIGFSVFVKSSDGSYKIPIDLDEGGIRIEQDIKLLHSGFISFLLDPTSITEKDYCRIDFKLL